MGDIDSYCMARRYRILKGEDGTIDIVWPILSKDGPLALIAVRIPERHPFNCAADRFADEAVQTIKTHLAHRIDSVLVAEYVGGVLDRFANVWVANQDDSHQDFALVWNFMDSPRLLEAMGLPEDLLDRNFPYADLPGALPLTQRQQEGRDSRQKQADTSTLLYCLEALQDILSRRPGSLKLQISEETAISLLAIHGLSAATALEGFDRFPD